jgi:ribonuclease D
MICPVSLSPIDRYCPIFPASEMADRPPHLRAAADFRKRLRQAHHDAAHDQGDAGQDAPEIEGVFGGRPVVVERQADLDSMIDRLRSAGTFAYDTEFVGEQTYEPQLCLIQIATDSELWLVDPMADLDLSAFWQLMSDPTLLKLVHAGEQDLEHCWRFGGAAPANVFDAQVAAGFVGLGYPVSLSRLVQEIVGVKLSKGFTFTDWMQRPLSQSQLRYAADDVRYLHAVIAGLQELLGDSPQATWVEQECAARCVDSNPISSADELWQRVRGSDSLDGKGVNILRRLVAWRDAAARKADVPARSFLRDELLIGICKVFPKNRDRLSSIKHMPRPVVDQFGDMLLNMVVEGLKDPVVGPATTESLDPSLRQKSRADSLWVAAQAICAGQQLDPGVVMNRQDVADLDAAIGEGKNPAPLRLMTGWRGVAVGHKLVELLTAGKSMTMSFDQRLNLK